MPLILCIALLTHRLGMWLFEPNIGSMESLHESRPYCRPVTFPKRCGPVSSALLWYCPASQRSRHAINNARRSAGMGGMMPTVQSSAGVLRTKPQPQFSSRSLLGSLATWPESKSPSHQGWSSFFVTRLHNEATTRWYKLDPTPAAIAKNLNGCGTLLWVLLR